MHGSNQNLHQDVIRIIASSDQSFDDAVREGIRELKFGGKHNDLEFQTFEVVQLQGTISDDEKGCNVQFFQAVIDAAGVHKHY